ncbi:MAG: GNAT family N-acetyltransferase [Phototrophicaceae bacterium]
MGIPVLITPRLLIREYTQQDLVHRHELTQRAFQITCSIQSIQEWLDWTLAAYRGLERLYQPPYGDYLVALKDNHQAIGSVGFVPSLIPWNVFDSAVDRSMVDRVSTEMGLYWAIDPDFWGNGYATEAANAFITYVFETLKLKQIVATTEYDNLQSQRVMTKLGMQVLRNPTEEPPWFEVVGVLGYAEWKSLRSKGE